MSVNFRLLFNIVATTVFSVLMSGCLDDGEQCGVSPVRVTLAFSYEHHTSTGDLFGEQMTSVDIFVYDTQGALLTRRTMAAGELDAGNRASFDLEKGDYTFVAWGNFDERHFTYDSPAGGPSRLTSSALAVNRETDGSVEIHTASLFHGVAAVGVSGRDLTVPVPMIKNTNRVAIYLMGKDAGPTRTDPETGLSVSISETNGQYDFFNTPLTGDPIRYVPVYRRINEEVLMAETTVLRLLTTDDVTLTITDANNRDKPTLFSEYLTDVIFSKIAGISTDEDLDRYDLYELTFVLERSLEGTWILTGIYSGDWTGVDTSGGI